MNLLTPLLYIVGIFLIIKSLQYILVWVKLMRERQQVPFHEWINPYKIPEKFTPVWVEADQDLSALGFQYAYAKLTKTGTQDIFSYVYVHSELPIFANASPTLLSSGTRSYDVTFTSTYENGELIITTDCLNSIELSHSKNVQYQALFLGDLNKHWQAHLELVNQLKVNKKISPIYLTIEGHLEVENNYEQSCFSHRISQGLIVKLSQPQVWRYSALGAIKLLRPLFKASKKLSNVAKSNATKILTYPPEPQETTANAQLIASVTAFERILEDENRRQSWGWASKTILFFVSVALTGAAFGLTLSWTMVSIALSVLLIHELGHLLGMKLFGYKDTQILFLPFLGAVTIGDKEEVTPMQKLVIYLLGPVPGVIGGFICAYLYLITGQSIWYEIAWMAIIINYINLLPILPLDGGKVIEAIFFSRFPRAQSIFYIVNTFILVGIYFLLESSILLFLASVFALSIPYQWKFGKAASEVSKILPPNHNRTNRLEAIFTVLNTQPTFLKQALPEKHLLAKQLFSHFSNTIPTLKTTLVGGVIYLLMLGLPIGGTIGWAAVNWWSIYGKSTFLNSRNQVVKETEERLPSEETIKQAKTDDERWELLMYGAGGHSGYNKEEIRNKSKEYYLQALEIAKTFPPPDLRYVNSLMMLASNSSEEESQNYYKEAIEYAEKHSASNTVKLAEILERLTSIEFLSNQEKIQYLEKALEIRTALLKTPEAISKLKNTDEDSEDDLGVYTILNEQILLSTLYEENQENDKAEELLKKALILCTSTPILEHQGLCSIGMLSDFYLRREKVSLAKEVLSQAVADLKVLKQKNKKSFLSNSNLQESELITQLAWVNVIDKDLNVANQLFEQAFKLKIKYINEEKNISWVNWIISRINPPNQGSVLLESYLDLSYVQLKQGKTEKAKQTFEEVKQIILSLDDNGTLDTYHSSLTQLAQYKAKGVLQENSSKESSLREDKKEGFESFETPPEINFNDPLIEKAKQKDRLFLRAVAHKEVFDKLK